MKSFKDYIVEKNYDKSDGIFPEYDEYWETKEVKPDLVKGLKYIKPEEPPSEEEGIDPKIYSGIPSFLFKPGVLRPTVMTPNLQKEYIPGSFYMGMKPSEYKFEGKSVNTMHPLHFDIVTGMNALETLFREHSKSDSPAKEIVREHHQQVGDLLFQNKQKEAIKKLSQTLGHPDTWHQYFHYKSQ